MIKLTSCDYDKRLFKYHQIYENVEFYGAVVCSRGVWWHRIHAKLNNKIQVVHVCGVRATNNKLFVGVV